MDIIVETDNLEIANVSVVSTITFVSATKAEQVGFR